MITIPLKQPRMGGKVWGAGGKESKVVEGREGAERNPRLVWFSRARGPLHLNSGPFFIENYLTLDW